MRKKEFPSRINVSREKSACHDAQSVQTRCYTRYLSRPLKFKLNVIVVPYTVRAKSARLSGQIENRWSLVVYGAPFRDYLHPVHGCSRALGAVPAFTAATNWSLSGITLLVSDRLCNVTRACAEPIKVRTCVHNDERSFFFSPFYLRPITGRRQYW